MFKLLLVVCVLLWKYYECEVAKTFIAYYFMLSNKIHVHMQIDYYTLFEINMQCNYTVISFSSVKNDYPHKSFHSIGKDNIKLYNDNKNAMFSCDIIDNVVLHFPNEYNKPIRNLNLYFVSDHQFRNDSLGFGFNVINNSYSIVHSIYNEGYINSLSFGFIKDTETKGVLYFGDIPLSVNINMDLSHQIKCKVLHSQWGCFLKKIIIDEYSQFYINEYVLFEVNTPFIYAPKRVMNEINDIMNNHEHVKLSHYKYPSLQFVFDGNKVVVMNKNITNIKKNSNNMEFILKCNENGNYWIIGNVFITMFISSFNYTDNTITFYSQNEIPVLYTETVLVQNIFFYNSITLFIGIIIILLSLLFIKV